MARSPCRENTAKSHGGDLLIASDEGAAIPLQKGASPYFDKADALADIFKLLGDPSRLRIVLSCLDGPKFVGDIALQLGLSQSLVSQHLRLLRSARLVKGVRHAKRIAYEVLDDHIRTVVMQMIVHTGEAHEPDADRREPTMLPNSDLPAPHVPRRSA